MATEQLGFDDGSIPHRSEGQHDTPSAAGKSRLYVGDLHPGMEIQEIYLVSSKEQRTTKAGKPFLRLRLSDRTAAAECVVWENAEALGAAFAAGDLVWVRGRVSEYDGKVQIEASLVEPCPAADYDPRDFLPCTYRDVPELVGFLHFHIDSVSDPDYSRLLHSLFGDHDFLGDFSIAPAAKQFHHAYLGGLLEHTVTVAGFCDHVTQQYVRVNHDLLITAALLHDVGKIRELTYRKTIDYSDAGRFLGHVILGVTLISEHMDHLDGFPEDKRQQLLHAIVSHHGELEWGSPKRPKTIEALILHHVDNLDAKAKGFLEIVEGSRNAEWTDLRNLFRRPLHIPRATHQEPDFLPPAEDDRAPS